MTRHPTFSVTKLAQVALWIGAVGFGGGFVVVSRMRKSIVEERQWSTERDFLEDFAVASALPGTTTTNLMTLLGYRAGGFAGAFVAASAFLFPSVTLMFVFAWAYESLRLVSTVEQVFAGLGAAVVGVVAAVAYEMRKSALESRLHAALAVAAAVALILHVLTLLEVVVLSGLAGLWVLRAAPPPTAESRGDSSPPPSRTALFGGLGAFTVAPAVALPLSLTLGVVCAKIALATFGGGVAMIPALAHEVETRGWMDSRAFTDAIALGQITPGPIAVCATFIGCRVDGAVGGLAATLGVFGAPFVLAVAAARSLSLFQHNRAVRAFLRGVSASVVGIIVAAAYALFRASDHTLLAVVLSIGALAFRLLLPKTSTVLPLVVGALVAVVMARWGIS